MVHLYQKAGIIKAVTSRKAPEVACFGCVDRIPADATATVVYPLDRAAHGLKTTENALICEPCYTRHPWGGPTWRYARMFARPTECEQCARLVRAPKSGHRRLQTSCSRQCALALNSARHQANKQSA